MVMAGARRKLQYPECPGGHIKVSDYNTLEGMEEEEEEGGWGRICRDQYGVQIGSLNRTGSGRSFTHLQLYFLFIF